LGYPLLGWDRDPHPPKTFVIIHVSCGFPHGWV
jgi:hypothetical protein